MKKMSYFVIAIISFLCFSLDASAKKVVVIDGYDVRFRAGASVDSERITSFNPGVELDLVDEATTSDNNCSKWYHVRYNNREGYVCGDYAIIKEIEEETINPEDYQEYSEYLKSLGFPDSYITSLIKLHNAYPNWQFKVFKSTIDFPSIASKEYAEKYKGLSLIEDPGRYYDGYKSTDSWSYNYLTDTFFNNFSGGGSRWYAASKKTIEYYLDPRNFLNEKQIFMFETLSYNSKYQTVEGIENMLKNTFMVGYADKDNNKTYVDAFIDAAIKYNVSPYVLISRVIQEVGAKGSTIVSGTVSGYEGYYNFYNIKAAGLSNEETIRNGLQYAKENGWTSHYKAIVGGAAFLADDYINQGQETLYLQKWDLFGPNYAGHQYMQNIQAPAHESIKTYKGYNDTGLINSNFVFLIPVFDKLPDKTELGSSLSPNNYLSTLTVNGTYLFNKPTNEQEFNLNLDSNTNSVEINATKVNNLATINGTGSISLTEEKQTIPITVTAGNGDTRIYKINITRNNTDSSLDISEILRVLNIKNDGNYIYGYEVGTNIETIIKSIKDKESRAEIVATDVKGNTKNGGIIASGDKIKIKTEREEKTYTIIIYGDVNGDGKIAASDYVMIKNHIMDIKKLNDFEKVCADANKDGKVAATDYVAIKNHIMEVKKITQ